MYFIKGAFFPTLKNGTVSYLKFQIRMFLQIFLFFFLVMLICLVFSAPFHLPEAELPDKTMILWLNV